MKFPGSAGVCPASEEASPVSPQVTFLCVGGLPSGLLPVARYAPRISGERQWKSLFAALQYSRRAFSFHFATFTPFTMSHRQSDNSPIRASTRMRKIFPAYAGARMRVKLFAR